MEAKNKELEKSSKKVNEFQSKIDSLQAEIDSVQAKINEAEEEIVKKEELIVQKENEAEERENMLGLRIRNYYKNDMTSQMLAFLVSSDGLSSFIGNIYNMKKILDTDKKLIDEVNSIKEALNNEKKLLEEKIVELDEEKVEIKNKQQELVNAQKEFVDEQNKYLAQMNDLKGIESKKQSMINSLSDKERELQEKIGDLTDFNQDLQNKLDDLFNGLDGGNSGNSQGETFLRPTSGRVTSEYGPRTHPISGQSGFHTGIDLASPSGTPIKASKSGTVVYSGWQGGYGQVVIIDHGGGYRTLYAHCSKLNVVKNQKVSRGQVVALVGSTGNSTGPHLHFEVRVNNKHQNPRKYVPI
ncbi:murein hydrolase activator EnvC family protein [Clostridium sp.]|nr:peptidoglycan DD-metalloendopeptidase family protein [Clostridium sp.]MDU2283720.1 peptidoglycan DD-metalloendopeptidase family protein [Clostridium sp.]